MASGGGFNLAESPEFALYLFNIYGYLLLIVLFLTYTIIFTLEENMLDPGKIVTGSFILIEKRVRFLQLSDGFSHISYLGTLIVSLMFVPVGMTALLYGYWKYVISKNKWNPLKATDLLPTIIQIVIVNGVTIGLFVTPLNGSSHRESIYYWPIFPAFGIIFVFFSVYIVCGAVVAILKIFAFRGRIHGRK